MAQQHTYPPNPNESHQAPMYPTGGGGGGYPGAAYPGGQSAANYGRNYTSDGGAGGSPWNQGGMTLPEVYDYNETSSRNYFVRRVFFLLSLMLAVTAIYITCCMSIDSWREFHMENRWLMFLGLGLFLVASLSLQCCPFARVTPWNYLCLAFATISMSLVAGGATVWYKTSSVAIAFTITCVLCVFLTLLACSNFDFTKYMIYVVVFGMVMMMFGIAFFLTTAFFQYIKTLHLIHALLMTLLISLMFIIELQMILGGKTLELNPDEYAIGALMMYTCIMNLFLSMLQITGMMED